MTACEASNTGDETFVFGLIGDITLTAGGAGDEASLVRSITFGSVGLTICNRVRELPG
jgi:hypothetical protein